jgi:putative transcriptional regulator
MVRVKVNRNAFEIALSRKNLAEMIGFSRAHLSHIINGRREPSPTMRRVILQHLPEYTFDDLFIIEENGGDQQS